MTFAVLSLLVLAATPAGKPQAVREVTSKEVVDLLAGVELVYDSLPAKTGFGLRLFLYREDGECSADEVCAKDKLLVSVTTYDEYPEKKAFEVPVVGEYKRTVVVLAPKKESGSYLVAVYVAAGGGHEKCTGYSVSLIEMKRAPEACRSSQP